MKRDAMPMREVGPRETESTETISEEKPERGGTGAFEQLPERYIPLVVVGLAVILVLTVYGIFFLDLVPR